MKTIISPSTANSMLSNGVFFNGKEFVDKYNNILESNWVISCYWTNQNSIYGCDIADLRTAQFCINYNLKK